MLPGLVLEARRLDRRHALGVLDHRNQRRERVRIVVERNDDATERCVHLDRAHAQELAHRLLDSRGEESELGPGQVAKFDVSTGAPDPGATLPLGKQLFYREERGCEAHPPEPRTKRSVALTSS